MKYFCVADVHGFYNEMKIALDKAGFEYDNPTHIFVSVGDLLDRGSQPKECLKFVNELPEDRKILIMGNHEILMRQMICGGDFPRAHDKKNGTWKTACDLTEVDAAEVFEKMRKNDEWWKYYNSCVYYKEVGNYIITHGWLPCGFKPGGKAFLYENWKECDDIEWTEATWLNGMLCWNYGATLPGKTIICGHWHTSWGWSYLRGKCVHQFGDDAIFEPFIDEGIVALDACTVLSKKVNCFVFEV